jgi:hypothetical protein
VGVRRMKTRERRERKGRRERDVVFCQVVVFVAAVAALVLNLNLNQDHAVAVFVGVVREQGSTLASEGGSCPNLEIYERGHGAVDGLFLNGDDDG